MSEFSLQVVDLAIKVWAFSWVAVGIGILLVIGILCMKNLAYWLTGRK